MADQSFTFDSQADWETGTFYDSIATDPSGKLTPGVSSETVAEFKSDYSLAVFIRCREGTGTTLENLGAALDGTASGATWKVRPDGRHCLNGGSVTVPYDASMAKADSDGHAYEQAGGMLFRSTASQVLMKRDSRFVLGIDSYAKPYLTWYAADGAHTITGPTALTDEWHRISFVGGAGGAYLALDGQEVAKITGLQGAEDPGTDLVVGCLGDYTDFALMGEAVGVERLISQPSSGGWVKNIQLSQDSTLRYIEASAGIGDEHTGSIAISFASSEDDLPYAPSWRGDLKDTLIFPPEMYIKHGTWMRIHISITCASWDRDVPVVDAITVVTRPVSVIGETYENVYAAAGEPEKELPENLEQLIADYRRLKPRVIKIERMLGGLGDFGGFGGLGDFGGFGGLRRHIDKMEESLNRLQQRDDPTWQYEQAHGAGSPPATQYWVVNQIWNAIAPGSWLSSRIDSKINSHAAATTGVHGVGTATVASSDDITIHAGKKSGVHGLSDVQYFTYTETGAVREAAQKSELLDHADKTTGVHGVGTAEIASTDDIAIHAGKKSGVHGLTATQYFTYTETGTVRLAAQKSELDDHAAASTGVHGVGSAIIASNLDITNHNEDPNAHLCEGCSLDAHASATSGIHGVGTSDIDSVAARNAAIDNHAAKNTGVHGVSYHYVAFSDQNTDTVEEEINTHADLTTGVHGVGASNVASEAYVDNAVANHNSSTNPHSNMNWATEGYADAAADQAVNTHQIRCLNYAT